MSTLTINYNYTFTESKHTQTGATIYILKILDTLEREAYKALDSYIKGFNGYYSKFVKGFIFKNPIEIVKGEQTTQTTPEQKTNMQSLYNRTQFTKGNQPTPKDRFKFVGSNYNGLSTKETAVLIRKQLKSLFPEIKFSITSDYNRIDIYILSGIYEYIQIPNILDYHDRKEWRENNNIELNAILNYCESLLNSYNYDDSDSQTDYFNCHYYDSVKIAYDYKQTEQTEEQKADILNFKNQLQADKQAEEEQKELDYIAYQKQQEQQKIENEKRRIQEVKDFEIINNNALIVDKSESKQYILENVKWANLNKNNTLNEYIEEVQNNDFYLQDVKISKEVHFKSLEALELFQNMLLADFDFIAGTGGSYTDNTSFTSIIDFNNMTPEERNAIKWTNRGVAIYFNNQLQFVVNAEGYNYSRYVGLTDEAIKIDTITEPTITPEQQQAKEQGEQIADISTNIITDLKLTAEEWKQSEEYKQILIEKLEENNIKLTIQIIRQIELETLKAYLYSLLYHLDSVQKQFEKANLQQGKQYTIISISDMMGMINYNHMTFDSYNNTKYAQYDDAIKIVFTPTKKRKQYYTHLHSNSNFILVEGWHSIPDSVLYDITESNGFICKKSKYGSCDRQQLEDIKSYLMGQNVNILINRNK